MISSKDYFKKFYAKVVSIMHVFKMTFIIADPYQDVKWNHDTLPYHVNTTPELRGQHPHYLGFP